MPLKSLAEIRGGSTDSPSASSGGLKSLQDIRFSQQQQSLMKDYPQMVADEQNYISDTPTATPQQAQENAQYAELMKQSYQENPSAFTDKQPQLFSPDENVFQKTMDIIGMPSRWIAAHVVPNAPDISHPSSFSDFVSGLKTGNVIQPGTNAQAEYNQMNPVPSTGNATVDKIGDVFGQLVGPMVGTYGTGIGAIPGMVDNALANAGVQFGAGLGGKVAKGLVEGAISGAPMNAAATLATTDPSISDLANSANQGILLGGALGAAGEALGAGLSSAGNRLRSLSEIGKRAYMDAANEQRALGITPFSKAGEYDNLSTDTKSQLVSKTKSESTTIPEKINEFYMKMVDNLQPINQFDKEVESVVGRPLNPSEKAYMQALNSRGSDMIARHIVMDSMVDQSGNVIGPSLMSITKEIPKGKLVDFEDYLINKDAAGRMEKGINVFDKKLQMTPEKARAKVAEYEAKYPQFKEISEKLYDFKNKFGKAWLADAGGMFTPEQWDAMVKENPVHVPMRRQFSEIEKTSQGQAKRGFANQSNPIKKAVGSQRKIISPIESIIEDIDRYVKTAKRNQVMQTVIRNIQRDPEAFKGYAEIVEQPPKLHDVTKGEITGENIDDVLNRFNENFDQALRKPDLTRGNIVRGYIDGKPVYLKVNDPQFLQALTNLSPQAQNAVVRAIGNVTHMMKTLTTGINPVFSLTRNIFRDIPTAYANSKTTSNPIIFARDLLEAFVQSLGNGKLYRDFKAIGGGHSSSISADRNLLAQSKNKILQRKTTIPGLVKKGLKTVYHGIENFNNALETAPRLAEYKRITQSGGNDLESKIKALFEANDVTVNFNRYGDVGKQLDAFFPYMNAALQGLDKFVRAYKDNPVKATAKSFAAVTIPTIVLYAINHNDPNYQKLSNYVKDNYFLIPMGNGKFFKIPKSREIGVPFGSMVERVLRQWWDKDPEGFRDFSTTVINAFAPPGVGSAINDVQQNQIPNPLKDTIAGPLVDLAANRDFANRLIVPGDLQKLSPQNQYDQNTSEIAKKLGQITGFSPKQLDFLAKSYLGGVAQFGIPANTKGKSIWDTLQGLVTADPAYSNDIARYFYDAKTKYDQQKADAQKQGTVSDTAGLDKFLTSVSNNIAKIRKQMDYIQNDKTLSDEQKQSQLRELQNQMNDMQLQALNSIKKAK
jgi:hypothetical protein